MIEIKTDSAGDAGYQADMLETSSKLEAYIDQMLMALESSLGSIMGADVTMDLEEYVFEMGLSSVEIATKVRSIIANFCSLYGDFQTSIDVIFAKGEVRDLCMISITVNKEKTVRVLIK